jgi:hypothetical protein
MTLVTPPDWAYTAFPLTGILILRDFMLNNYLSSKIEVTNLIKLRQESNWKNVKNGVMEGRVFSAVMVAAKKSKI